MKRGRWIAVVVCTAVTGAGTGLLYFVLYGTGDGETVVRLAALGGLLLYATSPFAASQLSGHPSPLIAGAGGVALGIGATVAAGSMHPGGVGAVPFTVGLTVGGAIALRTSRGVPWTRLGALVLLAGYALLSERLVTVLFVYPVLGVLDELVETFTGDDPGSIAADPGATS